MQIGAVIGRRFSLDVLKLMVPLPSDQLAAELAELTASGLVLKSGSSSTTVYLFKHALVQETAYESMLKSRRKELHAQVGDILENQFPITAKTEPETLARHFDQGGLVEKAAHYWYQAGQLAVERSSLQEAITHLNQGLQTISHMPRSDEHSRLELNFLIALGSVWADAEGWSSPKVEQAYLDAEALSSVELRRPYYLTLLAEAQRKIGQWSAATTALTEAEAFMEKRGERFWEAEINREKGELALVAAGDPSQAKCYFGKAIKIARAQQARHLELRATVSLARIIAEQGNRQQAYELLAPLYGGFTEGFEIADLKAAQALLDELA